MGVSVGVMWRCRRRCEDTGNESHLRATFNGSKYLRTETSNSHSNTPHRSEGEVHAPAEPTERHIHT